MAEKRLTNASRHCRVDSVYVALIIGLFVLVIFSVVPSHSADRNHSTKGEKPPAGQEHLQKAGLATHNYAANQDGMLPLAFSSTPDGEPLHSWRVAILPWLDRTALHAAIDFSEPWNGEANAFLRSDSPDEFQVPGSAESNTRQASFFTITGPETPFPGVRQISFDQVNSGDGSSNTLMFVEATGLNIEWAQPRDIPFSALADSPAKLRGKGPSSDRQSGDVLVLFCDGRSRMLSGKTDPAVLRALATWNGNEAVSPEDF